MRIRTPSRNPIGRFPDYTQNCGVCKHCTIKDYDKLDPPRCPVCGSDKAQVAWACNPCNNWVICENKHKYDIMPWVDEKDVELHQKTIKEKRR